MLNRNTALLSLGLAFTVACGHALPESSEVAGVSAVGTHKSPKSAGKNPEGVHYFLVKTTDKDFVNNYPSVIKTLTPSSTADNFKTLVPGQYKVKLSKGEYVFTGAYWHFESAGSGLPPYDNFIGAMYTVESSQLKVSNGSTLSNDSSQSEFVTVPSPSKMAPNGVSSEHIDESQYTVTLDSGNVVVNFPKYKDGRTF